jgi:glycosyltransferase involved in cell wall biosynthesis
LGKIETKVISRAQMISIIIPVCNGERLVANTLEQYWTYFSQVYGQNFEIIVVPNGCSDRTSQLTDECCRRLPRIRAKTFRERIGKGGAIREGFKLAIGDIVCFVDADQATSSEELVRLIQQLGDNDGVIGSRWLRGSTIVVKHRLLRRIARRVFNLLVRMLFRLPYRDTQCGAKVFTKKAIDKVSGQLEVAGFTFDVELLYLLRRSGCRVKEVPTVWRDSGASTFSLWREAPRMFLDLVRIRLIYSPFRWLVAGQLGSSPKISTDVYQ